MHFEQHAATYAAARPPYPAALWARVRELGVLTAGHRAVDLGAGTGQVTGPLLAAGLEVVAVEPGPQLAGQLREAYPRALVVTSTAEDADLGEGSFELAVAATSIHWMDLDRLLPRLHRALVADGRFLVWRNVYGDETAVVTPFRERVAAVVARRDRPSRRGLEDVESTAANLTRSGLFELIEIDRFRWSIDLDERQVRLLFGTFSDWSPAEVEEVASAVQKAGGLVTEHYRSWLISLRPSAS
jgi:SAM-dependent methyltransferase